MSKIMIVADIHLGAGDRLQDILWAMSVAREYAHRKGIDTVLSLGDMFHDRRMMGLDVMCSAYDFFSDTRATYGQNWITFPGNHDMHLKHSWEVNSLRAFQDVLTVIDTVKLLTIDGVRFWILPFIHLEGAYMRVLRRVEAQYQEGDILLTHIGTVGAVKNVCFLLKDWSIISFDNSPFDQVYTGHFHAAQQVGRNVWYPGSLIPFKFDEGDCPHGLLIYDLAARTHEFIDIWEAHQELSNNGWVPPIPGLSPDWRVPPNFITIPDGALDAATRDLVSGNIVRIATADDYSPRQKSDAEEMMLALGARAVRWMNLASDDTIQSDAKITANIDGDLFEMWLETDAPNNDNLDKSLLRQLHSEIVREADELYNYEDTD